MDVRGKRLLFLGATSMMATAVETARKLGVYTIVADYNEDPPAKRIADRSYLISTADTDALLEVCRREKVDGVFSGYSETNQYYAMDLTERGGYFNYATREQLTVIANKAAFKALCGRCGVPVVPGYRLTEELWPEDMAALEYPVIIKPTDSFSGKGITICRNRADVERAVPAAVGVSRSGQFLAERYLPEGDFDVVTAYYTVQDGKAVLSSMTDRCMVAFPNQRRLNTALLYPSMYLDRFEAEMDGGIRVMLREAGIQNGTLFFEGGVNEQGFLLWEAGFRLCGAQQNIFPAVLCHVDVQEMLIFHALTGKMADTDRTAEEDPRFHGKSACNGILFVRPGTVGAFHGLEEAAALPGVAGISQLLFPGSVVTEADIGTLNQTAARFHVTADSRAELFESMRRIRSAISVTDTEGREMLLDTFDYAAMDRPARWAVRRE